MFKFINKKMASLLMMSLALVALAVTLFVPSVHAASNVTFYAQSYDVGRLDVPTS